MGSEVRLLRTKLHVPVAHPDLVPRARLARQLDAAGASRLTVVSAPAGFGKTTLVSDWLRRSGARAAWISLDGGDNEPVRFWSYLVAALDTLRPGLLDATMPLLRAPQPPPVDVIVPEVLNAFTGSPDRQVLVLDDYHAIENPAIHEAVASLVSNAPPGLRLLIISRQEPPLPLALLRARRQLTELHAGDLRFTAEETETFLNQVMGLGLSTSDVATLESRIEGWAAALQLAALSIQETPDAAGFIRAFAASNRYVFDYLAQEVLQRQRPEVRGFLLRTSILRRVCGPLADAVTGAHGGQATLEGMERAGLFVTALDPERRWFRYHPLFAEFIRLQLEQEMDQQAERALYRSAAAWLYEHADLEEAIRHRLAAGDVEEALAALDIWAGAVFETGELPRLLSWIAELPDEKVKENPRLCLTVAWALLATGQGAAVEPYIAAVERALGLQAGALADRGPELPSLTRSALVEIAVIRASVAWFTFDLDGILRLTEPLLPYLNITGEPSLHYDPADLRPIVLFNLALAYEFRGRVGQAARTFAEAATSARERRNHHLLPIAMGHLAQLQIAEGRLHDAARTCSQAMTWAGELSSRLSPMAGIARAGMGALHYEWNHLAQAKEDWQEAITLATPWKAWESLVPASLGMARLRRLEGDWTDAHAQLDALAGLCDEANAPLVMPAIAAARARLWAEEGRLELAAEWAAGTGLIGMPSIAFPQEPVASLVAQTLAILGRNAEAEAVLTPLMESARAGGRTGKLIEWTALQAVVLQRAGRGSEARAVLEAALEKATSEGYVRTFVDQGETMAALLGDLATTLPRDDRSSLHGYVRRLLAAFSPSSVPGRASATPASPPRAGGLAEPLSSRESEVLALLAIGHTNQEIAGKLVVSVNTVKTHVRNIYQKLGATNRAQAVARARELRLL